MSIYYLYKKTHNQTGMKYLGKTENDPFKYLGSGTHWLNHLRVHGKDITTEILGEYQTKEQLKEAGIYYSNLWNVVESKEWANLIPETGDGVHKGNLPWNTGKTFSIELKHKLSISHKGIIAGMSGKKHSDKSKKKMSLARTGKTPWNKGKKGLQVAWNKGLITSPSSSSFAS